MAKSTLDVLYEDNHCLAVNKPAGLLTQGDITGEPSLVDLAKDDLKVRFQKPGNVFVGLVHRLDRTTSGVVLLARTSKAASRLSTQFRDGTVEKIYWAIVEGIVTPETGEWSDTLSKDEARNVVRTVRPGTPGGLESRLAYRVVGRKAGTTWVEVRPITGRSHQIRVQFAERGFPIAGDRKYGAKTTVRAGDGLERVALHARRLTFKHPTREEAISVLAPVTGDWPSTAFEGTGTPSD
ncbi:RluA family pseudouridine synthase [Singulisphaera rosea]